MDPLGGPITTKEFESKFNEAAAYPLANHIYGEDRRTASIDICHYLLNDNTFTTPVHLILVIYVVVNVD